MRRITISIDDEVYSSVIDYAADNSKDRLARFSMSRAIRNLLADRLRELDYYPSKGKERQGRGARPKSGEDFLN